MLGRPPKLEIRDLTDVAIRHHGSRVLGTAVRAGNKCNLWHLNQLPVLTEVG